MQKRDVTIRLKALVTKDILPSNIREAPWSSGERRGLTV
jgi:hypothetical protein